MVYCGNPGAYYSANRCEQWLRQGGKGSFPWIRPEHMEAKGRAISEVLNTIKLQEKQCAALLQRLKKWRGALFKVTMSVNALGRIDLYQWIYFIAQHARRHLAQMQENFVELQRERLTGTSEI
jgi:hypothetical protein